METDNLLQTTLYGKTMDLLKRALDYGSANQQVISGNMANVDTPGYRQMTLKFDEELQRAEAKAAATLTKTDERHLSGTTESMNGFTVETKKKEGIDMDAEMAKMTQNNLLYEANTRLLTKKLLALKAAIKGSY